MPVPRPTRADSPRSAASTPGRTPPAPPDAVPAARRRARVLAGVVLLLTLAGVVLAAVRPTWLVDPLRSSVVDAGAAAPLLLVLLCALAAPLHLSGVVAALSTVVWPLPEAAGLSYAGAFTGCVLTAAVLARLRPDRGHGQDGWPPWLRRLTGTVRQHPLVVGVLVRAALSSGLAVEAFYVLTGYTRRQYLLATSVGLGIWVVQTLAGVTVLTAVAEVSPGLAPLAAVVPAVLAGAVVAARRRRRRRQGHR